MAAHNSEMAKRIAKPAVAENQCNGINGIEKDPNLPNRNEEIRTNIACLNEEVKSIPGSKMDACEIESQKVCKRARKRIVTTVVQQVEYVEESDGESPKKCIILEDGQARRKQSGKSQMQSILNQICSLVRSLDLSNLN